MDSNVLAKIYKVSIRLTKSVETSDDNLSKILGIQTQEAKEDKKERKERETIRRRKEQLAKRKEREDGLGRKKEDKEVKEKKKSLVDMLKDSLGGLLGGLGSLLGGIAPTLTSALGGIMGAVTPVLSAGLGALGGVLSSLLVSTVKGLGTLLVKSFGLLKAGGLGLGLGIGGVLAGAAFWATGKLKEPLEQQMAQQRLHTYGEKNYDKGTFVTKLRDHYGRIASQEDRDRLLSKDEQMMAQLLKSYDNQLRKIRKQESKIADLERLQPQAIDQRKKEQIRDRILEERDLLRRQEMTLREIESSIVIGGKDFNTMKGEFESGHILPQTGLSRELYPMSGTGADISVVDPIRRQTGGLVPTLLEPGEKVFAPGTWDSSISQLNKAVPRFQTGGEVTSETTNTVSTESIISSAEKNIGLLKNVGEQCANTTRQVLADAGHPQAQKATQQGDLDPEGTAYNGLGFAASFAGSDMGEVKKNFGDVEPGDIMLWKGTYGVDKWGPNAITHVGIAGEGNQQYDHSRARGWEKTNREQANFAAAITLNGSGGGNGTGGGTAGNGDAIRGGTAPGNEDVLRKLGGVGGLLAGIGEGFQEEGGFAALKQIFAGAWDFASDIGGGLLGVAFGGGTELASMLTGGGDSAGSISSASSGSGGSVSIESGKWAPVLELIAEAEAGSGGWEAMYPGTTLPGATNMTIAQVANQATGAVGMFQNLPRYLNDRAVAVGLDPNTAKYNKENQIKIAEYLIGPGQANISVADAKNDPKRAMLQLSKVWAAIPKDDGGASYYAGDGVNKAHITPQEMYAAFEKLQTGGIVDVPGQGSGDKIPMMLPQGSFVLNRNASSAFDGMQRGGRVNLAGLPSQQIARMSEAQANYTEQMAMSGGGSPIVVFEDEAPPTVSVNPDPYQEVPNLPNGPSTVQAAEYFYHLNLGGNL